MAVLMEDSGIPLYVQVVRELSSKISAGDFLPGEKIPPEAQLCEEFGVSRITIRRAIKKLVDERLLYTKQGKGTFVNPLKIRRRLPKLYSFSEDMLELGLEPSSRILEQAVVEADAEMAVLLSLPEADRLVNQIVRVRMANKIPVLIERSFVPHYLCPDLLEESFEHKSLYRTLSERYKLELVRAEETYEVRLPTAAEAKELGCKRSLPAFAIQRLAFRVEGSTAELTRSVGRGDLLRFSTQLITHEMRFSRSVINIEVKEQSNDNGGASDA
jgi:GntR family transcriptional regulator